MQFQEIIARLGDLAQDNSLQNNPNITGVAAIHEAQSHHLSYIEGAKFASQVSQTAAAALILPQNEILQQQATERGIAWIATAHTAIIICQGRSPIFYQPYRPDPGIHPTAIIDPSAKIGKGCLHWCLCSNWA